MSMNHARRSGDNPVINAPEASTTTMGMREPTETELHVAEALYDRLPRSMNWRDLPQPHKDYYIRQARCAIQAMREPPYESWDALAATGKMWRELDSTTVWQTFIDAASPPEGA